MTPLHRGRASRVLRGRMLLSRTLVVSIVGETTTSERLSCAFCKVIVLRMCIKKAEDETRTRDNLLGRQMLYQLSYFRIKNKLKL